MVRFLSKLMTTLFNILYSPFNTSDTSNKKERKTKQQKDKTYQIKKVRIKEKQKKQNMFQKKRSLQFINVRLHCSSLTRKQQENKNAQQLKINQVPISGIYIVKYSDESIKIGRSKNIHKRLNSYRGYTKFGEDIERLLLIYTDQYQKLEKHLHLFAQQQGLIKCGGTEVFKVNNIQDFIYKVKKEIYNLQIQFYFGE